MSSQVNKSRKQFKPRTGGRRTRLDSSTRRNSAAVPTNFHPVELQKLRSATASNESVFEEEFKVPEPPQVEISKKETEEPVDASKRSVENLTEDEPASKDDSEKPDSAGRPTKAARTDKSSAKKTGKNKESIAELFVQPAVKDGIPQPVQPIGVEAPGVEEEKQQQEEETGSDSESDREVVYDDEGREILEPKDIKRMGKTNAKMHFHNKVINAETFTMAALCADLPIGDLGDDKRRKEDRKTYHGFEAERSRIKRHRTQLLMAKRMIRGSYMPRREEKRMELLRVYKEWEEEREHKYGAGRKSTAVDIDGDDFDAPATLKSTIQLQLDSEGKIVIDDKSTQVDRHEHNRADEEVADEDKKNENLYETRNSASFRTKERPERWSPEETNVFFKLLSSWGTDFNLIAQFFPQRTRAQIKTKFKYEERKNPEKVNMYLIHRKKVSIKDIKEISGKEIVPIEDIEADLEAVRREHEQQVLKEVQAREDAAKEDAARKTQEHTRRRIAKGITGTAEVVGEIKKDED